MDQTSTAALRPGWHELWRKEDWWAVWLGLGLVLVASALYASGGSIAWLAVAPAKWSTPAQLGAQLWAGLPRYLAQFATFLVLFGAAARVLGFRLAAFAPSFALLYALSLAVFSAGAWDQAQRYNLEPPLIALLAGLAISNLGRLPRWLDAGFRVEFYVKTGIVLLGATLPFTLILWAGPVAILQASVVSVATFGVIFLVAVRLGLDRRLAARRAWPADHADAARPQGRRPAARQLGRGARPGGRRVPHHPGPARQECGRGVRRRRADQRKGLSAGQVRPRGVGNGQHRL